MKRKFHLGATLSLRNPVRCHALMQVNMLWFHTDTKSSSWNDSGWEQESGEAGNKEQSIGDSVTGTDFRVTGWRHTQVIILKLCAWVTMLEKHVKRQCMQQNQWGWFMNNWLLWTGSLMNQSKRLTAAEKCCLNQSYDSFNESVREVLKESLTIRTERESLCPWK